MPSTKSADQRPALLALENTHNSSGGRCWPLAELRGRHGRRARARASDASRRRPAPQRGRRDGRPAGGDRRAFDTVTLCLSKGLGCPLGAVLAGPRETIDRAWREKHLFGGAMRQAGIVAAGGRLRARPPRRAAGRRPRARAAPRRGLGRGGASGRPRSGRDELRPGRRRCARARPGRRSRAASRRRRRALVDDPSDSRPRRDASRRRRRRDRAGDRAGAPARSGRVSPPDARRRRRGSGSGSGDLRGGDRDGDAAGERSVSPMSNGSPVKLYVATYP